MVALHEIAAHAREQIERCLVLDAFGDDRQRETPAEFDGGTHDRTGARALGELSDEGTVDLDLVDRQLAHIGERRVARAEIVDGQRDAETAQRVHYVDDLFGMIHERGFGEFETQRVGRQAEPVEQIADIIDEATVEQIMRRDVDANPDAKAGCTPIRTGLERTAQDPARQSAHESGRLGERDELLRRDQAPLGMAPAQQGLRCDHLALGQFEQRLKMDFELVAIECAAQLAEQRQFSGLAGLTVRAPAQLVEMTPLRSEHRGVREAQQIARRRCVVRQHCDADARIDIDSGAVDKDRLRENGRDLRCDSRDLGVSGTGQDQNELVAALARDEIARAQGLFQSRRDFGQHTVPGIVPEGLVDQLEAVEVEHQHRQRVLRGEGTRAMLIELAGEQHAIGEPGQLVAIARCLARPGAVQTDEGDAARREQAGKHDRPG